MSGPDDKTHVIAARMDHEPHQVVEKIAYMDAAAPLTATGVSLSYGWQLSRPMPRDMAMRSAEQMIATGEFSEAHVLELGAVFTRSYDVKRTDGAAVASAGFFGRMNSADVMRDRGYQGEARMLQPANLGRTLRGAVERNQDGGTYASERAAATDCGARLGATAPVEREGDLEQAVANAAFNGEPDIDGEQTADELARSAGGVRPAQIDADTPAEQFREPVGASTFGRTLQAGEEPQT